MADYFTNLSFIVPLKDDAHKQFALTLSQAASSGRFEETKLPADFPEPLKDVIEDWAFEVEDCDEGIAMLIVAGLSSSFFVFMDA